MYSSCWVSAKLKAVTHSTQDYGWEHDMWHEIWLAGNVVLYLDSTSSGTIKKVHAM